MKRSVALSFLLILFFSPAAYATRLRRLSLAEIRERAAAILIIDVTDSSTRTGAAQMVWTDYAVRVAEVLRGPQCAGEALTLSFAGGRAGGLDVSIEGVAALDPGSRYVVFLEAPNDALPMPTVGWTQGVFHVTETLKSAAGEELHIDPLGQLVRTRSEQPTMSAGVASRLPEPIAVNADGSLALQHAPPASEAPFLGRNATLADLRAFVRGAIVEPPQEERSR